MSKLVESVVESILSGRGRVIPLGARRITRSGDQRFHIWLPQSLNSIWRVLWKKRIKVCVYLEIPETLEES